MTDKAETIDNDQEAVPHEDTGEELAEEGEDLTEEGEDMTEEEMRHAMAPKPTKIELEGKTMADFEFFRQRKIVNKEGEETGHGLVAVPKDSCIIQVEYKCPYCQYDGYDEQPVPEPKVNKKGKLKKVKLSKKNIKLVCGGCGKTVYVQKLKD